MRHRRLLFLALAALTACSSSDTLRSSELSDTGWGDPESDGGVDTAPGGLSEAVEAAWWWLSADLSVESGQIASEGSSLSADFLDDERNVICSVSAPLGASVREEVVPHESVSYWWTVSIEAWGDGCDEHLELSAMPLEFQLGLGAMHPEILAVLDNLVQAQEGSESMLQGAYASFDSGKSLFVFGAGGTAMDFAGETRDESQVELSGFYFVHPLYPFIYPAD